MIEAAQELYGKGRKEAIAVQRAYAAINVGASCRRAARSSTSPRRLKKVR
jgi:hypothetical protein